MVRAAVAVLDLAYLSQVGPGLSSSLDLDRPQLTALRLRRRLPVTDLSWYQRGDHGLAARVAPSGSGSIRLLGVKGPRRMPSSSPRPREQRLTQPSASRVETHPCG